MSRRRSGDRLYRKKKDSTFYAWFYDPATGERVVFCTKTRDRDAARALLAKVERDAYAAHASGRPAPHRGATGHTVANALDYALTSGLNDVAPATLQCYATKAGHALRLVGQIDVNRLSMEDVQGFIETRKGEGAHTSTIYKELVVLRLALKQAHDRKLMRDDPRGLFPKFSAGYVPRDTYLTRDQVTALLRELGPRRVPWVLVAVSTSGRLSEVERLRWETSVDVAGGWLLLPGTKTTLSKRKVKIPKTLLDFLTDNALERVVEAWPNVRRDLAAACRRAGIPRVSPNDLRRTFASWMLQAGETNFVVAKMMGHSTTKMVDTIYGQLGDKSFEKAAEKFPEITVPERARAGSASVAEPARTQRIVRAGRTHAASTGTVDHSPRSSEAQRSLQSTGPLDVGRVEVPGPGIEPGTRGFSVPCSTI